MVAACVGPAPGRQRCLLQSLPLVIVSASWWASFQTAEPVFSVPASQRCARPAR